jgi:hypothetical protein
MRNDAQAQRDRGTRFDCARTRSRIQQGGCDRSPSANSSMRSTRGTRRPRRPCVQIKRRSSTNFRRTSGTARAGVRSGWLTMTPMRRRTASRTASSRSVLPNSGHHGGQSLRRRPRGLRVQAKGKSGEGDRLALDRGPAERRCRLAHHRVVLDEKLGLV